MTGWLLDTNVLSELRRPRPHAKVLQFVSVQSLDLLHVSVVTFAEIRFGIELLQDAGRRMELNDWLTNTLRPMFDERLLDVTEDIMLKWRLLVEDGRRVGHTFAQPISDRRFRAGAKPNGRVSQHRRLRERRTTIA